MNLLLTFKDSLQDWELIGWKRLGSAMIDDLIVGYADQKSDKKTLISYKFLQHIQENFQSTAVEILSPNGCYSKFSQLQNADRNLLDTNLSKIAERIAERIREEHRKRKLLYKAWNLIKIRRNRLTRQK